MNSKYYDYVIIGAGILGLTLAYELSSKNKGASVLLLEKEPSLGLHSSGRNSGVLHSGIYYPEGTLKAKFCASGAKKMKIYCQENQLPVNRLGKVIVPTNESHISSLNLLLGRAKNNRANVSLIDEKQLNEIEPEAFSLSGQALYSPDTSVVDPIIILKSLAENLKSLGVHILFEQAVISADPDNSSLNTTNLSIKYGFLYNASGQNIDKVAKYFGVGDEYEIIPFKGSYYKLDRNKSDLIINGLIYPVPDLNVPFLGIHSVKTIYDDIYFGPSAVLAFGRENYQGFQNLEIKNSLRIGYYMMEQFMMNKNGFRKHTINETLRSFKFSFSKAVKKLVPRINEDALVACNKVGIRAQLFNVQKKELVMDFLLAKKDNTIHVLNAVSPAFTSSFSMAEYIINLSQK